MLRQYLPIYGAKTGSRTHVVLVDGYAGPGRYADESPGSPELMVKTARALRTVNAHCVFVERDRTLREQLKTLLVDELGDRDSEVPTPQGYEFWHALKTLGVPTALVIYENEGHAISGREHQRDIERRIVAWFDQYLKRETKQGKQ